LGVLAGRAVRSTVVASYVAVAGRSLADAAAGVRDPLGAGDLDEARRRLPALVGRDPSSLDEPDLCRAVVESVAENTVDAIVAPALWAVALGASGALGYRAVNTMDAMVGYRSDRYERFGTAAARLDDIANWVPARVTAALVAAARPTRARDVWRTVRRDAGAHPSPNAGVAEAAFAAALGVRLGGVSTYGDRIEERPTLGDGRPATVADIDAAVTLSRDCTAVLVGTLAVGALVRRRRRSA
jgi:adenosylcobinamide-phosphate synthase